MDTKLVARLLYIPSFYGAIMWWLWLGVYLFVPLGWDHPQTSNAELFVVVGLLFSMSAVWSARAITHEPRLLNPPSGKVVFGLASIGLFGILYHLFTLADSFHGVTNLLSTFLTHSFEVRWENAEVTSIGTQLSYAGWLAAGLLALRASDTSSSLLGRVAAAFSWIAILSANLLMVDRTRPFWIVTTSVLMVVSAHRRVRLLRSLLIASATFGCLAGIFTTVALWSGKVGDHTPGSSTFSAAIFNLALYGTGGFAYFDRITSYYPMHSGFPERTLYPLMKFTAAIGVNDQPPSQILDFESIPHEVNVGTLLAPFYQDGGWIFLGLLVPIVIVGVDRAAISFLRSPSPIQRFGWAALCFAQLLSFFSPPLIGTPCWLFVIAAFMSRAFSKRSVEVQSLPAVPVIHGHSSLTEY